MKNSVQKAYFAGGCFWGVEYFFQELPGVKSTKVGFMGGDEENPTYEEVSSGKTGHVEAIEIVFDDAKVSYEDLAKLFFEIHDSTQVDGQGPDIGKQYRSTVFYTDEKQKKTAKRLIAILKEKGFKVVTRLEPANAFWEAEEDHQEYYAKKGGVPYCHIQRKLF